MPFPPSLAYRRFISSLRRARLGATAIIGATPSGLALAHHLVARGQAVTVWDPAPERVGDLRMGACPCLRSEARIVWHRARAEGRLGFTNHLADALAECRRVVLAVSPGDTCAVLELYAWLRSDNEHRPFSATDDVDPPATLT